MKVEVELPDACECGGESLNIWGTRIRGKIRIETTCARCGKKLWKLD